MDEHRKRTAIAAMAVASGFFIVRAMKRTRNRTIWCKEWLSPSRGAYNTILSELRSFDNDFKRYLRMNEETFEELLAKVRPCITKQTTKFRKPIAPELKLAITLRYLATGEDFESLMFHFRVHSSTIAQFIPTVCYHIYQVLRDEYMKFPKTEYEWNHLVDNTFERWHFPNAWGAIDGKHVRLLLPADSGSNYYCYKGFHSIVLMAVVGYDYKFLYVDVGCQGRISDGGVFKATDLYADLEKSNLGLPAPRPLPVTEGNEHWDKDYTQYPYFLVGDSAFSMTKYMMKPYDHNKSLNADQRIFNYRLSRLRRVSENAFGILVNRFRLWLGRCSLSPEEAEILLMASVVLHNMLCTKSSSSYLAPGEVDFFSPTGEYFEGSWRRENLNEWLPSVSLSQDRNPPMGAKNIRDNLAMYFGRQGSIPWQWKCLM